MFVSEEYAQRNWTRLERRSALHRAVREWGEYVLPARFDNTLLPDLLPGVAYVDLRKLSPLEFAERVAAKLARLGAVFPRPPYHRHWCTRLQNGASGRREIMTSPEQAQRYVLDALRDHFSRTHVGLDAPQVVELTELDEATVYNALRLLHDARRIEGVMAAEFPYPLRVTRVLD